MKCDNPLSGRVLGLELAAFSARDCVSGMEHTCQVQLQNELKDAFDRMLTVPLMIQLNDKSFESINIQICSITELSDKTAPARESMSAKQARIRKLLLT